MVSDLVYESHLVVAVVYPALLGDSVGCRVNLLHNPDEDHYLVDADATANVPISYAGKNNILYIMVLKIVEDLMVAFILSCRLFIFS